MKKKPDLDPETVEDIGVVIAMPAELKHRFDSIAAQAGISTPTLILALALQGLKGPSVEPSPATPPPSLQTAGYPQYEDDAWRGPPPNDDPEPASDVDVDAMVASRVAEAQSAGLTEPPGQAYEAFGPPTSQVAPANVRSLRRPPPQFGTGSVPPHLRSL
jgi:hypothetical protein